MYLDYFGFEEKPFTITPNPRFLFLSKNHKEVFAHLLYGIRNRTGFIEVTGEVGSGKTTVLRTLFQQLDGDDYRLAFIFNPSLSATQLLRSICREFGLTTSGEENGSLLEDLNAYLLRENQAGRTVVLVIDEAQNLTPPVLEQVRLLSNLETESDKLIQIVLVGQPELGELLERADLRQLSQRITVRYHLRPMDAEDTGAYIRHRLELAGCRDRQLFSPGAVRRIYRLSRGLPRLINVLCDRSLLVAFSEDKRRIDLTCVRQARRELSREARKGGRWGTWIAGGVLGALVMGIGIWLPAAWQTIQEGPGRDLTTARAGNQENRPAATPDERDASLPVQPEKEPPSQLAPKTLRKSLGSIPEARTAAQAFSALSRRWGEPGLETQTLSVPEGLRAAAKARDLVATPFSGSLEHLLRLDTPVMLELSLPGFAGRRYLALTGKSAQGFTVMPEPAGQVRLERRDLEVLWTGQAWLLWRNYARLPNILVPEMPGSGVARLQELLAGLGLRKPNQSARFDRSTIEAVTRLQARRGILQDGRVGPQTLLLLYQESSSFSPPRLGELPGGAG